MTESRSEQSVSRTADLHERLAVAARVLAEPSAGETTIQRVARLAVGIVDSSEGASASICRSGGHEYAWSAATFGRCAMLQHELKQGPYFDLSSDTPLVVCDDLSADPRWPHWSAHVQTEFGMRSMMSVRLFTDSEGYGAVTLFSRHLNAYSAALKTGVVTFAAIASAALQSAHIREQLEQAIESRTIIGQAQGIIMERFHVDAREAFDMLKRVSQKANVRIRELADETIATREHPDAPTRNPRRRD